MPKRSKRTPALEPARRPPREAEPGHACRGGTHPGSTLRAAGRKGPSVRRERRGPPCGSWVPPRSPRPKPSAGQRSAWVTGEAPATRGLPGQVGSARVGPRSQARPRPPPPSPARPAHPPGRAPWPPAYFLRVHGEGLSPPGRSCHRNPVRNLRSL